MSGASERQEEKKEIVKTQSSEKCLAWRVRSENNNTFYRRQVNQNPTTIILMLCSNHGCTATQAILQLH